MKIEVNKLVQIVRTVIDQMGTKDESNKGYDYPGHGHSKNRNGFHLRKNRRIYKDVGKERKLKGKLKNSNVRVEN